MRPLSGLRQIAVFLFLQVAAVSSYGQRPVFVVYFNAGTIKYVPVHNGPARPLGFHNWLSEGDRVVLGDNIAELILFDRDSNYLRLDGKGNYTVAALEKMPRKHISDSITLRYLSLLWDEAPDAAAQSSTARDGPTVTGTPEHISGGMTASPPVMLEPPYGYTTSLDSVIFRWRRVSWAQKYFLRIRSMTGELLYDSVLADTQAGVNFAGRMPFGATYYWALDLIGESGRLQFGDSSHIVLIDEAAVLRQLPPLPKDSLGGIAAILRRIEQYEAYGCLRHAIDLFRQLNTAFPTDGALDMMYRDFLRRNGLL